MRRTHHTNDIIIYVVLIKKEKDFTNHCKSNLIGRGVIYLAFTDRGGTHFVLQGNRRSHPSSILMGFRYVVEYKKIFTHL